MISTVASRLYSPADFGTFAFYASLVGAFGLVATLRYEMAVILPRDAKDRVGGFALSLFGYDSKIDEESLTRGGLNRRIDVLSPDDSLLLKKPLMKLAHIGGQKLAKGKIPHQMLRDWIAGVTTPFSMPLYTTSIFIGSMP